MVTIPLTLNTLPIIRSLDVLPLDGSFCLVAETGTGKTMIIPVMIHLQTGRKVILRQPTRAAASQVYKALNKFWGQQVDIGIHTSDMSIGGVKECDIMVCTDGVMRHWLRDMEFEATIVFDEAHSLQAPTEIEMGVVKTRIREGRLLDMVILSATIRPSNILKWLEDLSPNPTTPEEIERVCTMLETHGDEVNTTYQPQWMKLFYAEGVPYEISDRAWPWDGREETKQHPGPVLQWCNEVKRGRERGLAFLTTRKEVEMMASLVADQIPGLQTDFVHADRDIDKIIKMAWEAENLNEPLVLFSTPVLGTSVTIPFGHVLVRDRGLAERFEYGVKKTDVNLPRDSNSIIQMRGRCFSAGTPVVTPFGYASIEEIECGDPVLSLNELTKNLEWKTVIETYVRDGAETIGIRSRKGTVIHCTPDHPILSSVDPIEYTEASTSDHCISINRIPPLPFSHPLNVQDLLLSADNDRRLYVKFEEGGFVASLFRCFDMTEKRVCSDYLNSVGLSTRVYKWKKSNQLPLWVWSVLSTVPRCLSPMGQLYYKSRNGKVSLLDETLRKETMWLVGMVATDGCLTSTRVRITNKNQRIIRRCQQEIQRLVGRDASISKKGNSEVCDVEISSAPLNLLIRSILNVGENKTRDVRLWPHVFRMGDDHISSFIAGCIDGDGSIHLKDSGPYQKRKYGTEMVSTVLSRLSEGFTVEEVFAETGVSVATIRNWIRGEHLPAGEDDHIWACSIRFFTASEKFADDMRYLFLRLGIRTCITKNRPVKPTEEYQSVLPIHEVRIDTKYHFTRAMTMLNMTKAIGMSIPHFRIGKNRPNTKDLELVSIGGDTGRETVSRETVYNIEVEDNHNYIVGDMVVHNCGRLRPGIFTLVSSFRSGMQDVKPCPVEPPLENQSPNELVIICAQYGVDPNYLDVLSDVLVDDVRHAVNRLKWWGIVREDEDYLDFLELVAPPGDDRDNSMMPGELTLTKFGWSVSVLPLEIERAVMVRRAPRDILPIIIAIAATPDIFRMFKHEVTVVGGNRVPGHDMLDPNLKYPDSSLLTKAKILQAAVRARADPNYTLPLFAEDNGLWKRTLEYSLNNYYRICAAMRRSERRMREEFRDMDIDSLGGACMAYLCSLNIFELVILSRHMYMHSLRYWGDYDVNNGKMLNCSLDGAELAVIDPRDSRRLRVMGTPKVLTSGGRDFVKWSDTIVVKRG